MTKQDNTALIAEARGWTRFWIQSNAGSIESLLKDLADALEEAEKIEVGLINTIDDLRVDIAHLTANNKMMAEAIKKVGWVWRNYTECLCPFCNTLRYGGSRERHADTCIVEWVKKLKGEKDGSH